ncbi:hypothetical protein [Nocardioides sp. NPDC127503]|uniref:hypothetical protein n=1 Tax=Nocardioides sp. NPDC127503 TaxID=3154516 RepID=UPI003332A4FF
MHDDLGVPAGLADYDPVYFSTRTWDERVVEWMDREASDEFAEGNRTIVRQAISDDDAGLRVFVNLGAHALLGLLPNGRYLNLYERPAIGAKRVEPSEDRREVDLALGLEDAERGLTAEGVYFAALGLGGVGLRFYGEYCLVLKVEQIDPNPGLFDRDSYDILLAPISELDDRAAIVAMLKGVWRDDRHSMVEMRVLPQLARQARLVTAGTVSEAVLKDQEFIEVHLRPDPTNSEVGGFGPEDIEEVRESPDEVAVASRLRDRDEDGEYLSAVEFEWLLRRECVARAIGRTRLPSRVVTQHGRGYQWK